MSDASFLHWPFFEHAHRDVAATLATWVDVRPPDDEAGDIDAQCRGWVKALGAGGWLQHAVPPKDVRTLCLARETLAYRSALADFAFAMQGLGAGPIALFGTESQKQRFLPAIATGDAVAAFALSESEAGSDVAALAMRARRDGDAYVIDGEKMWISNAGIADTYVVFARTSDDGHRGLSAFVVPVGTRGLTIAERIQTISPHPLGRLHFDGVRIDATNRLGEEGEGFKIAMATLDVFRSTVGAAALGFARRALDESVAHAKTRSLFGAPLADLQLTQSAIAEMATDVDASALLVYRAAWTKDRGAAPIPREAAMAKWFATEAAGRVADRAVQLFGGRGVKRGEIVERIYRDVRALRIYEGASEVQQVVIARQVLGGGG
ncbi:MAG: acyl-CoA dehydrogenase family protein [Candidatus Eremiobacteraeota bacterium]|nr:acyl-CoA dehydrogenase family protein [Candidatus Eremiobacteraeota bacterium]